MDDRLVTAVKVDEEAQDEAGLRPRSLNEYIGQDRVRENLIVSIAAARQRGEALDHVLLYGPPGLGKTTLAYVIGNELGAAASEISRRSRGTPRIANRLLRRVRDFAQVRADGAITLDVAHAALQLLEVDEYGFDEVDRKLLRVIIDKFGGGPVGVNSIAA